MALLVVVVTTVLSLSGIAVAVDQTVLQEAFQYGDECMHRYQQECDEYAGKIYFLLLYS